MPSVLQLKLIHVLRKGDENFLRFWYPDKYFCRLVNVDLVLWHFTVSLFSVRRAGFICWRSSAVLNRHRPMHCSAISMELKNIIWHGVPHFLCAVSDRVIVTAPKISSCPTNDKFFARQNSFVTTGDQTTICYTHWPRILIYNTGPLCYYCCHCYTKTSLYFL